METYKINFTDESTELLKSVIDDIRLSLVSEKNVDEYEFARKTVLDNIYVVPLLFIEDKCYKLTKKAIAQLDWTEDDLFFVAYKNLTETNTLFSGLTSMVFSFGNSVVDFETAETIDEDMAYVLTNENMFYGASKILDYKVMDKICTLLNSDKLYVLPSSIHEVLLVPVDTNHTLESLTSMVRDINKTDVVSNGDFLSDNVYVYVKGTGYSENPSVTNFSTLS